MKITFALAILCVCIGFLNAAISATSITAMKPIPVQNVETNITLTINAGDINVKTTLYFHLASGTAATTDPKCDLEPKPTDTTVVCKIKLPTAQQYALTLGSIKQTGITAFTVAAEKISSITPTTASNGTETTITIKAVSAFDTEKFQFYMGDYVTSATVPTQASCTISTDKKSTACTIKPTAIGVYKLFIDQQYEGDTVTVSSGYVALAFGIFLSIFLF